MRDGWTSTTTSQICVFCHAAVDGTAMTTCDACGAAYHPDCLAAYGGCAVPGCAPGAHAGTHVAGSVVPPQPVPPPRPFAPALAPSWSAPSGAPAAPPAPVPWGWIACAAAILVVMLLVASSSGDDQLAELAADTCDDLDGSTLLVATVIFNRAIDDALDLGHSGDELRDAVWDTCPGLMGQIVDALEELQ